MPKTYDYVIVGAGSAGCVAAYRILTQTSADVLLLEAGPRDNNMLVHMPAAVGRVIPVKTWPYMTTPDAHTGNRPMSLAQGKLMGGSSSVNGMIYIRGQRQDYDAWASDYGCAGWGYDDLLPYFRKAEHNESLRNKYHNDSGPLPVSENRYRHPLSMAFVRAGQAIGLPYVNDFNGADQQGVGFFQTTTTVRGRRASTSQTYLKAVRGSAHLDVVTDALVQRVVIEKGRATGVVYKTRGGTQETAHAKVEVLIAAGAIGTPKVLMLSGVGPAEQLTQFGIHCVADLPVGSGLQDHLHVSVNATTREPISIYGQDSGLASLKHGFEWLVYGRGLGTSNVLEAGIFIDTNHQGRPDVEIHFLPVLDTWDDPDHALAGFAHGITLKTGLIQPKARGSVRLAGANPEDLPLIEANYLGVDGDVDGMIRSVKAALSVVQAEPMAQMCGDIIQPGRKIWDDRAELVEFVRRTCKTTYHPIGTCRMGPDSREAVVDTRLRVYGVEGLRVIDASVFPSIPSGNTNAPVIAVAEKAMDLILEKGGHVEPAADLEQGRVPNTVPVTA
ncbi:MAG TPA: GMC family oxidoreductase N-terminal domain-containing protein [Nevskiaceae bacterium]